MKTTEAEKDAAEDISALSAEMARMRAEIASLVESIGRVGLERVEALAKSETVSGRIAAGEAAITDAVDELREIEARISASTRERPWRALGIAACVGFLFGFLTRR